MYQGAEHQFSDAKRWDELLDKFASQTNAWAEMKNYADKARFTLALSNNSDGYPLSKSLFKKATEDNNPETFKVCHFSVTSQMKCTMRMSIVL